MTNTGDEKIEFAYEAHGSVRMFLKTNLFKKIKQCSSHFTTTVPALFFKTLKFNREHLRAMIFYDFKFNLTEQVS